MSNSNVVRIADYQQAITEGYEEYRKACYGDQQLPVRQLIETKQAFISGVHWLASLLRADMPNVHEAARNCIATLVEDSAAGSAAAESPEPVTDS